MPRRIRSRQLAAWRDPELVFRGLFADAAHAVWLDGGSDAASGVSVLAAAHATSEFVTADAARGTVTRSTPAGADPGVTTSEASVFEVLAEGIRDAAAEGDGMGVPGLLGWFGWFGYELGALLNEVPADQRRDAGCRVPLRRPSDRVRSRRPFRAPRVAGRRAGARGARRGPTSSRPPSARSTTPGSRRMSRLRPRRAPAVRWRHGPERYAELIAECQAAIVRGDAYQLCLTNRVDVDARPDPAATYLALRASSPSHHGGYLRFGGLALLSASPEQFLHVDADGLVSTKPMKGTRPRGADALQRREPCGASSSRATRNAPRTS